MKETLGEALCTKHRRKGWRTAALRRYVKKCARRAFRRHQKIEEERAVWVRKYRGYSD